MHVFTYSERANTKALEMKPVVPIHERNQRTKRLRTLSFQKMRQFQKDNLGDTRKVLFEGMHQNGLMEGYTDNYIKVSIPFRQEWNNEIVEWKM